MRPKCGQRVRVTVSGRSSADSQAGVDSRIVPRSGLPIACYSHLLRGLLISMQGIWTAVVAVAGTLLGSAVTYFFQRKASERAEAFNFKQQLRAERVTAYSDFIGAVTELLRAQDHWWNLNQKDPDNQNAISAEVEVDRLVSTTYHALARIELVADNPELVQAAGIAYQQTWDTRNASTEDELTDYSHRSNKARREFIEIASHDAQQNPVLF